MSNLNSTTTLTKVDKGQEFALNLLKKYGWEQGKGLGKNEDGIAIPIKPSLKFNTSGVGYDAGEEFTYQWWNHAFNSAAKRLVVNNTEGSVTITHGAPSTEVVSTRRAKKRRKNTSSLYGNFVQCGTLINDGTTESNFAVETLTETEADLDLSIRLSDEQLFAKCGKLTGHKAARHGHKLNGKLLRLEQQDQQFLDNHRNEKTSTNTRTSSTAP